MPSKRIKKIVVSTGQYTHPETQEVKKRWLEIGSIFQNENGGLSLNLKALPLAKLDSNGFPSIWANIWDIDNDNKPEQQLEQKIAQQPQQQATQPAPQQPATQPQQQLLNVPWPPATTFDDNIPF